MLARICSGVLVGLDFSGVTVEVDVAKALPSFEVVGLPDLAVKESKDRIRAALKNAGFVWPLGRITVNLAPANVRKEGPIYDLAMALGILLASGQVETLSSNDIEVYGELSLGGEVRRIKGVLPLILSSKSKRVIIPESNLAEVAMADNITVFGVSSLREALAVLLGQVKANPLTTYAELKAPMGEEKVEVDMGDVKGHDFVKRGLEIAAAGNHNLLLLGPPGSGKTMLAKALLGILPDISREEAIQVTKVYSVSGLLNEGRPFINYRPFRAPHHHVTTTAMIGGGSHPQPGELSLSLHGVLFLDELAEFRRDVLEALRQPLEEGTVRLSRLGKSVSYPAQMLLVGALNPCPCGMYFNGDESENRCRCTPLQISKYLSKISGPFLDRMDLQLEVSRVPYKSLTGSNKAEATVVIKERVTCAREIQLKRLDGRLNSDMTAEEVKEYCQLNTEADLLLSKAYQKMNLSGRGLVKIKTVARTVADLRGSKDIAVADLAQAIQMRALEHKYFRVFL